MQQHAREVSAQHVSALSSLTETRHADVAGLLASLPPPDMPDHLAARIDDAITAESARRLGNGQ